MPSLFNVVYLKGILSLASWSMERDRDEIKRDRKLALCEIESWCYGVKYRYSNTMKYRQNLSHGKALQFLLVLISFLITVCLPLKGRSDLFP